MVDLKQGEAMAQGQPRKGSLFRSWRCYVLRPWTHCSSRPRSIWLWRKWYYRRSVFSTSYPRLSSLLTETGSLAAAFQSSVGSVAAGGIFATLQSAGAGGYGVATVYGAVQAGGVGLAGKSVV